MSCFKVKFLKSIWNFHWSKFLLQRHGFLAIIHFHLTYTTSSVKKFSKSGLYWLFSSVTAHKFCPIFLILQCSSYGVWFSRLNLLQNQGLTKRAQQFSLILEFSFLRICLRFWFTGHFIVSFTFSHFAI